MFEVRSRTWPDSGRVDAALGTFGLSLVKLEGCLRSCVHPAAARPGVGFQQDLGPTIERHLATTLATGELRRASTRYSSVLNEKADVAIGRGYNDPRIFFEVEFRPNVEKDLIKFQIGANTAALALGVLIVALDRNAINPGYTTMPGFAKFEKVISELQPTYPLVLLGFRGTHSIDQA